MTNDILAVGDKVELKRIRLTTNEFDSENIYKSQILDFISEDRAVILMPIEKGRIIPLNVGDKYSLRFFTKKGLFQCKAIIEERSRVNNIYTLTTQFISQLEKYQRRQYYRLECILDISFCIISEKELYILNRLQKDDFKDEVEKQKMLAVQKEFKEEWFSGTILDISGGGLRFVSEHNVENGTILKISVRFGTGLNAKTYLMKTVVISSEKMINRNGFYELRVQFKDITKEEREAIIKFIFEEERIQRKREKG